VRPPNAAKARLRAVNSTLGLFKTEVIRRQGPWRGLEDVEMATLTWVHWFNHERLLEPLGDIPPAEYEHAYYAA
jgi:transposase InsO family protein